jgi:nucleoside-diphosphate-sugar epimerase
MRVLVTGGTGYLGQAIVRALIAHRHEPVVFARSASVSGLSVRTIDGDVRDRAAVRQAAGGVDAIIHAASLVSIWHRRPALFDEINIGGLEATLDAARVLGIRRIVYTSSFLAHPPSGGHVPLALNDYQRTKVKAGAVARDAIRSGLPLVSLVPGVIYGPGKASEGNLVGRMIRDHLARRLPGLIAPNRRWSYAFIDDVAEAHVTSLIPGVEAGEYLLGGENATQARLFEIVKEVTGAPMPRHIPGFAALAAAYLLEMRARISGRPPAVTPGAVHIFHHDWSMDSARSVQKLSYRITPLSVGVRALLSASS